VIRHHGLRQSSLGAAVVTIGSFDGVHAGHQYLINRLHAGGAELGAETAVVTFEPHPRCVLEPARCPASLTTLDEKLALFESLNVDHGIALAFTPEFARLTAAEFMERLANAMSVRRIVCGPDFGFGFRRGGNPEWLREQGYDVEVVSPLELDGTELHSSEIRRLLEAGEIPRANRLLGRPFMLSGTVEHGAQIGRGLGYPTANLAVQLNKLVPGTGIYAVRVKSPFGEHGGALNIGHRPTFGGGRLTIEVYLLDFEGDLYGKQLQVSFVQRLRDEEKYESSAELAAAIARDVEETRRILLL
jgi:riboflavin kinase/FMN adenylyltransferase